MMRRVDPALSSTRIVDADRRIPSSLSCCVVLAVSLLATLFFVTSAHAATASWSFTPSTYDFGIRLPETGPSAPKAFTLTNTGEVTESPGFVALGWGGTPPDPELFSITANSCGALAPSSSCTIEVAFDPKTAGPKGGQLSVGAVSGEPPPTAVTLTGTGAGPVVSIAPTSLLFDGRGVSAGASASKTLTVTNEGQLPLTIASVAVANVWHSNADQFAVTGGTCRAGVNVAPASSCTVEVVFSPTVPGAVAADLRIADNAPGSAHLATLEGYGVAGPHSPPLPIPPILRPSTAIFHRPGRVTTSRRAMFWFRGSATAARFECKLDRQPLHACQSPTRYEGLKPGRHYFAVRAIDGNGLSGVTAAVYRWRIVG